MNIRTLFLLSLVYNVLLGQTPPNPKQGFIILESSPGSPQYAATTNYVDRLTELFRLDFSNERRLLEQYYYYGTKKVGYHLYYSDYPPRCEKVSQNYAYMLEGWQGLLYGGKIQSISHPGLECNVWNQRIGMQTYSYLASARNNTPVEILFNGNLQSIFTNYTLGPSVVPKNVFDLPVPENTCT